MENGRNNKIAAMGFVCACLVVMVHQGPVGTTINSGWWWRQIFSAGICGIANSFFFIVSGYFLTKHVGETGWWHKEVWKRVRTLLIPMFAAAVLLTLISLPITVVANIVAHRSLTANIGLLNGSALSVFCLDLTDYPYFIPLWFVRALFGCVLLSGILAFFITRMGFLVPLALVVASYAAPYFMPWAKNLAGVLPLGGLAMFSLGMYLQLRHINWSSRFCGTISLLVGLAILGIKLSVLSTGGHFNVTVGDLATPFILFGVWTFMKPYPILIRLATYSFPLYLLHWCVSYYGQFALGLIPMPEWIMLTLWAPITICTTILLTFVFRKLLPRTAAICFGGRM